MPIKIWASVALALLGGCSSPAPAPATGHELPIAAIADYAETAEILRVLDVFARRARRFVSPAPT